MYLGVGWKPGRNDAGQNFYHSEEATPRRNHRQGAEEVQLLWRSVDMWTTGPCQSRLWLGGGQGGSDGSQQAGGFRFGAGNAIAPAPLCGIERGVGLCHQRA